MSLSGSEYLRHMLDEILFLQEQSIELELKHFLKDEALKRAFVRSLSIIGEAAKHLTQETRLKSPHIKWTQITGMRDRLVHDYLEIDYEIVWEVVKSRLPELKDAIRLLLDQNADDDFRN